MCPQSNAACCIIYAAENKASKISKKPVWIVDHDTAHVENYVAGDTFLLQEKDRERNRKGLLPGGSINITALQIH